MTGHLPETKRSRIVVLAHALRSAGGLSVGQNMIAALGRVAPRHHYLVTIPSGVGYEEICDELERCDRLAYGHDKGLAGRWLFENRDLPRAVNAFRPDVLLALGNRGLLRPPCPQAILCHEPHFFYPPRHYGHESLLRRSLILYHKRYFARQLRNTRLLLCQTSAAEKRLRETFSYRGKTAICPNAVSEFTVAGDVDVRMPEPLEPYADRFRLFYLTRFYAHKNLEILVELFRRFAAELKNVVVVITVDADQHPHAAGFLAAIDRYGLNDHIVNVGPLPQSSLAGYFRNCQALFMPTLLESFSGTYLEAMHFGLPILTSDLDFARAVCDDAALYADPWNVNAMKEGILELMNNPELGRRLVEKARNRLKGMFRSWDEVATDLARELDSLVRAE